VAKSYQLRIQLERIRPPIWRRILVRSDTSLAELHEIIQVSMGWYDYHLHLFEKDRELYGPRDPGGIMTMKSERAKLSSLINREKERIRYEYDFGDSWSHVITLEKIEELDPGVRYPTCTDGRRACPPEDCGGVWGYARLCEALSDPTDEEHQEMLEWVGDDFDAENFDVFATNGMLGGGVK